MTYIHNTPWALYNEIDEYAAEWIENLVRLGVIAPGVVDRRSIEDILPDELRGFRQCHFFAGIGVWSYALRGAGVSDDTALWTGSCPCFTAGTLVLTKQGNIPIEEVKAGDLVLTHTGDWKPVIKIGSEFKHVGVLSGHGHHGITTTPDHPFLSRTRTIQDTNRNGKNVRLHKVSDAKWSSARDMPGKWWAMPLEFYGIATPKIEGLSDVDLAFIAGAYVGEGWLGKGNRNKSVLLGLNKQKADEIEARLSSLKFTRHLARTGIRLELSSQTISDIMLEFGQGASTKTIPNWVLCASTEVKQAFLDGWDVTDGTRELQSGSRRITTTSRNLAIIGRMLMVSMGYSVSLRKVKTANTTVIEGRQVNQLDYYTISRSKNERYVIRDEHGAWFKAKSFEPSRLMQRVFNIEVEDDHSYLADGIIVHNCQPFSAAGKGAGFTDERHLWPAWFHLIQERRPPKIYGEQVASADGLGWLDLVCSDLEEAGYAVGALDTCSAGSGAPHIRQRLRIAAYDPRSAASGVSDANGKQWNRTGNIWARGRGEPSDDSSTDRMAHTSFVRRGGGHGPRGDAGSTGETSGSIEQRQRLRSELVSSGNSTERMVDTMRDGQPGPRLLGRSSDPEKGSDRKVSGTFNDGGSDRMADADGGHPGAERQQRGGEQRQQPQDSGSFDRMAGGDDDEWGTDLAGRGPEGRAADGRGGSVVRMGHSINSRRQFEPHGGGSHAERMGSRRGQQIQSGEDGVQSDRMGDSSGAAGERNPREISGKKEGEHRSGIAEHGYLPERFEYAGSSMGSGQPGPTNGFWRDADWLFCRDGKWRPVGASSQQMAHGSTSDLGFGSTFPLVKGEVFKIGSGHPVYEGKSRQGMLKGYGNAIDAQATIHFIRAAEHAFRHVARGISDLA